MKWQAEVPYNDLPDLPPQVEIETKEILKLCIEARVELEALRQAVELIPNQLILIQTISILEAKGSSEIENIVTTTDSLFKYIERPQNADPATKEALKYRTALFDGMKSLEDCPLSLRTARVVCTALRGMETDVRVVPGTYLGNPNNNQVVYTPPVGKDEILEKMFNWEKFVNGDEQFDPLITLALAHYQFEAIHPFGDGNGRTGRILNILFLVQRDLLCQPILYLSRYIIKNKGDYYRRLIAVTRDGAWLPWVEYMLTAVKESSRWTKEKVLAIRKLEEDVVNFIRQDKQLKKIYSRELVDTLFSLPYTRIQSLVARGLCQRQTAAKYLELLVSKGILEIAKGGKENLYLNRRLMKLLSSDEDSVEVISSL